MKCISTNLLKVFLMRSYFQCGCGTQHLELLMLPVIDDIGVAMIGRNLKPAVNPSKLIGKYVCLLQTQYN